MRSLEVVLTFKSDVKRFKVIKAVKCYPNCVTAIFSASFNECIHYTRCTALLFRLRFFINTILIDRNYCKIISGTKLVCHYIQATCIAMNFQEAVIYLIQSFFLPSPLPPLPPPNKRYGSDRLYRSHLYKVIPSYKYYPYQKYCDVQFMFKIILDRSLFFVWFQLQKSTN